METREYGWHLVDEVLAGRLSRRELFRRAAVAGIGASAIGTLLAACSTDKGSSSSLASKSTPKRGGSLTVAQGPVTTDVDPISAYSAGAGALIAAACEPLVINVPPNGLAPCLATSWHPISPSEWEFQLRRGVKFQDGTLMTSADVVASFQTLTSNPESASLSSFQGILSKDGIEATGKYSVRFHLEQPFVDFPYLLTYGTNVVILPKDYKIGDFIKGKVGTGPFILSSFSPSVGARFVRNPDYWGAPRPYLDEYVVNFYSDPSAQLVALEGNNAQVFSNIDFDSARALKNNPNFKVLEQPGSGYRELSMRVDRSPWTDVRVRQALALTLNRPEIVSGVLGGFGRVANDHGFAWYFAGAPTIAEVPQRAQNIAMAKQLLADAGYPHGLSATLTTEEYLEIPTYVTAVKAQAAMAGFNISLDIEPQNTYYGSGNNQPWLDVPLGVVDWATRPVAPLLVDPAYTCGAVWNSAHWCNPRYTALVTEYAKVFDASTRRRLAVAAAQIQHDQVPAIIAYWLTGLVVMRSNVEGFNSYIVDAPSEPGAIWLS